MSRIEVCNYRVLTVSISKLGNLLHLVVFEAVNNPFHDECFCRLDADSCPAVPSQKINGFHASGMRPWPHFFRVCIDRCQLPSKSCRNVHEVVWLERVWSMTAPNRYWRVLRTTESLMAIHSSMAVGGSRSVQQFE